MILPKKIIRLQTTANLKKLYIYKRRENEAMSTKPDIQLSDHFGYKRLIRFTLPTIVMMLVASVYGMVDGLCVSNIVGKEAFAAVNIVLPLPTMCTALGTMLGTGGAAYLARKLGQKHYRQAHGTFTVLVLLATIIGLATSALGIVFMPNLAKLMGANESLLPLCTEYGRTYMLSMVWFVLQALLQAVLITAERPKIGLWFVLAAGITNIGLDVLFMYVFGWGLKGAAWATFVSSMIGSLGPLIFFLRSKNIPLHLTLPHWNIYVLKKIFINGSSDMVIEISAPLCSILYNLQLIRLFGEDGIAAYGVIMYVNYVFTSLVVGYLTGLESIVGFHYGARNTEELHSLRRKSRNLINWFGITMFAAALLFAPLIANVFVGYDATLCKLTTHAFRLYALSFLIMGFNAFVSSMFTGIGNGGISALISFCRTFLFQVLAVLTLPQLFEDGIWLSLFVGELFCLGVSFFFYRKRLNKQINETMESK